MSKIKHGDTHEVVFTLRGADGKRVDLAGASARVLAQPGSGGDVIVLPSVIGSVKGTVVHQLTGTLPVDWYRIEVEVTANGVITTAPTGGYGFIDVIPDLDSV